MSSAKIIEKPDITIVYSNILVRMSGNQEAKSQVTYVLCGFCSLVSAKFEPEIKKTQ